LKSKYKASDETLDANNNDLTGFTVEKTSNTTPD
jgi:hypothetical protein